MKRTHQPSSWLFMFLAFAAVLASVSTFSGSEKNRVSVVVVDNGPSVSSSGIRLEKDSKLYEPQRKNESYVISLKTTQSGYYSLTIGPDVMEVFLAPGDHLLVSSGSRASLADSPFSGTGAMLNSYIFEDKSFFEDIRAAADINSIYAMPPLKFSESIDALFHRRDVRLEEFIRKNNIKDDLFVATERKRVFYGSAVEKNLYYRDHKFLTGEKPELNADYDVYLKQADLNDSSLLHLKEYRNFLYTYFERLGLQDYDLSADPDKRTPFIELSYARAKSSLSNPKIKSYVLYRIADIHLNETPIDELGNLVDDFNKECREEKYLATINRYYARLQKLRRGMPAPGFSFPDVSGHIVSLSNFRKNLVYLDIWNSHCSPCFKEFPILDKLMEKYQGKKIIFIGISFDSDETLWKKTMRTKGLNGIQLFARGWESQFARDFLVYSNPRFILIDENGNFISAKAPRPSENIEEILDQYVK